MASQWSRPKVSKVSHNVVVLAIMGSQGESQLSIYVTVEAVLSLNDRLQHGTKMCHKIKDLASTARRVSWLCRGRRSPNLSHNGEQIQYVASLVEDKNNNFKDRVHCRKDLFLEKDSVYIKYTVQRDGYGCGIDRQVHLKGRGPCESLLKILRHL